MSMQHIDGGITAPLGFRAAGVTAGVKKSGKDVAVVYSEVPTRVAAVFTTNIVKAAPVLWSQRMLGNTTGVQAIVVNSGNANACTGPAGMEHAISMCETAAKTLGIAVEQVLVASTGVIGVPLPLSLVTTGILTACHTLSASPIAAHDAAQAIMTTDTYAKEIAVAVEIDGKTVTIGGMAKGSGMIHPNMATMLGFITTDANIEQTTLDGLLRETTMDTFNMISVDGDTSTNDTVMALANGLAGHETLTEHHPAYPMFREAFRFVGEFLAKQIVKDGEGASKFLEVRVEGAATTDDARKLVKSIITSSLVKTAFFGEDANWGRILAAMGYSGATFDVAGVGIAFASQGGYITLMTDGEPENFDEDTASQILKEAEITVHVRLSDGSATATGWGCDLSYEYVRINGDYRT